ncbi:hypothetical protein FACS1894166_03540 [Bacilli bacterium]|nr:hypothetical protein FACS1894166_03540 [Bacilli bacterium]
MASFFAAFITILFLKFFYPTNRIVKLEIYTSRANDVIKRMLDIQYAHSATLNNSQNIKHKKPASTIVTYCLFNEIPRIVEEVRRADEDSFITCIPVTGVNGFFNEYRQGDAIKPKQPPVPPTL